MLAELNAQGRTLELGVCPFEVLLAEGRSPRRILRRFKSYSPERPSAPSGCLGMCQNQGSPAKRCVSFGSPLNQAEKVVSSKSHPHAPCCVSDSDRRSAATRKCGATCRSTRWGQIVGVGGGRGGQEPDHMSNDAFQRISFSFERTGAVN